MASKKTSKKPARDWNAFNKRKKPVGYSAGWLKRRRKSSGLSLRAVAEVAGVHYVTIWAWEQCDSRQSRFRVRGQCD